MPSLNIELGFWNHPKVRRTIRALQDAFERDHFFACLFRLWEYAGNYHAESGKLWGYADLEIEELAGWRGKAGRFIRLATEREHRWIDVKPRGYEIHDWLDHEGHIGLYRHRAKVAARVRHQKRSAKVKDPDNPIVKPDASSNACRDRQAVLVPCTALPCTAPVVPEGVKGEPPPEPPDPSTAPDAPEPDPEPSPPSDPEFLEHCARMRLLAPEANDLLLQLKQRNWKDAASVTVLPHWRIYVQRRAKYIEEDRAKRHSRPGSAGSGGARPNTRVVGTANEGQKFRSYAVGGSPAKPPTG